MLKMGLFALLLSFQAAADCCDKDTHRVNELNQEKAKLCEARGGIPQFELEWDNAGHQFLTLKLCQFPCDKRLEVEK